MPGKYTYPMLYRDRWAILDGDWKLVRSPDPEGPSARQIIYAGDSADAKPALFNLKKDPAEQHNVAQQNTAIVERLSRLYEEWRREVRREATNQ